MNKVIFLFYFLVYNTNGDDIIFDRQIFYNEDIELNYIWTKVVNSQTKDYVDLEIKRIALYASNINGKQFKFVYSIWNKQIQEICIYTSLIQRKATRVGYAYKLLSTNIINRTHQSIHNSKYLSINSIISSWAINKKKRLLYILSIYSYLKVINDNVHVYVAICRIDDYNRPFRVIIEEQESDNSIMTIVKAFESKVI